MRALELSAIQNFLGDQVVYQAGESEQPYTIRDVAYTLLKKIAEEPFPTAYFPSSFIFYWRVTKLLEETRSFIVVDNKWVLSDESFDFFLRFFEKTEEGGAGDLGYLWFTSMAPSITLLLRNAAASNQ